MQQGFIKSRKVEHLIYVDLISNWLRLNKIGVNIKIVW